MLLLNPRLQPQHRTRSSGWWQEVTRRSLWTPPLPWAPNALRWSRSLWLCLSLWFSLARSLSLSHPLSFSHTHTHTLSLSLSLTHKHSLVIFLSLSRSVSLGPERAAMVSFFLAPSSVFLFPVRKHLHQTIFALSLCVSFSVLLSLSLSFSLSLSLLFSLSASIPFALSLSFSFYPFQVSDGMIV